MCPVCLATVALVAGGGASVAGGTALIWRLRNLDPAPAGTAPQPEATETDYSADACETAA